MAWLTLWLKKIILLVLLAAFLDLILPNTTLQRYVKMVMGLIILLTIMSPLFSLFRIPPEELAHRLLRYQQQFDTGAAPESEWKNVAENVLRQQHRQVEEYVSSQMESLIREQVRTSFGVEVASVEVRFRQSNQDQPTVDAVMVQVVDRAAEEAGATRDETPVRPIEPIRIEVGREQANSAADNSVDSLPAYSSARTTRNRAIAAHIAGQWQLKPEVVTVTGVEEEERR
ncbi:MAG: stage III sporulation protein AF [Brevibacillus sp.]|nr:stage III sporulation protein AF [Brevibacillus sp.]